jgi:AraC family transcriptional regulator
LSDNSDFLYYQILSRLRIASRLEIDGMVLDMLQNVMEVMNNKSDWQNCIVSPRRLEAVELAKSYMHTHYANDISLSELSQKCFISPFHFSRIFKRATGVSPHQYLIDIRLKQTELMLKSSKQNLTDIAYAAGFTSTAYFITSFSQRYGVSPAKYRKSFA